MDIIKVEIAISDKFLERVDKTMAYSLTRLTLYTILSSMETDIRNFLGTTFSYLPPYDFLGEELFTKTIDRVKRDHGIGDYSLEILLLYADFGDLIQLINKNSNLIPNSLSKYFKSNSKNFEKIIPIRNRVAHSRPLLFEDLPTTLDFTNDLLKDDSINWHELKTTLNSLEQDESFVLHLQIPKYNEDEVFNNLPLPDFDETGYFGRKQAVQDLKKLLTTSPYPVISVLGDGGVGKTAIALYTAYGLLDTSNQFYDGIIWTSSKTTKITINYIEEIENSIKTSSGMLDDIAEKISGKKTEDSLNEIIDYMKEFRILLIMDNLETVLDDKLENFFKKIPMGSKVVITSRIGLGAFEYPFKLEGFVNSEAKQFFRAVSRIRGVDCLVSLSDEKIIFFCKNMNNNPGYIKWFISAVQSGTRPEDVIANSHIFLDFCMSNVYNFLSNDTKYVLATMLSVSSQLSLAELSYYTKFDPIKLQETIYDLLRTNMVKMITKEVGSSVETRFELSELSRKYLSKHHPVENATHKKIQKLKKQYVAEVEKFFARSQKSNPYGATTIRTRTKRDWLVAKKLKDAISQVRSGDLENATEIIGEAKRLDPAFFEVLRVDAYINTKLDNLTEAQQSYETALELEPDYAPLYKFYGEFLLNYLDDAEGALSAFEKGFVLDDKSNDLRLDIARCCLYLSNFEKAISNLWEIIETESDYILTKKAYDLLFQCFYRIADKAVENHEYSQSVAALYKLMEMYNRCPDIYKDAYNLKTLSKIPTITNQIQYSAEDSHNRFLVSQIINWTKQLEGENFQKSLSYYDIGKSFKGIIKTIYKDRNFGFIQYSSHPNGSVFFHISALLDSNEWEYIKEGDYVLFKLARNDENKLQASEVEIIDNLH